MGFPVRTPFPMNRLYLDCKGHCSHLLKMYASHYLNAELTRCEKYQENLGDINVNGLLRLRFIIVESSSSNFSVVQLRDNFGRLNAPINIELCRRLLQGLL